MKILRNFISIEELEKRWGIEKGELVSFARELGYEINLWYARETRLLPDGRQSAIVKKARYTNDSLIDVAEILQVESAYPEVVHDINITIVQNDKDQTPKNSNTQNDIYRNNLFLAKDFNGDVLPVSQALFPTKIFITTIPKPEEGEYYPAEVLMQRYQLSPAEFLEYISKHEGLYPYGITSGFYEFGVGTPERLSMLKNFSFHYLEIQKHEKMMKDFHNYDAELKEHKKYIIVDDSSLDAEDAEQSLDGIKKQLIETQEQVEVLTRANEQLREQNQRITAELDSLTTDGAGQVASRTQAATFARQEKTLNAWKPAIDAMIKVAVRCGEEGKSLRQQPDFNIMFNEIDAEINSAQMNLFRKALPDEHIDRTGGPRGNGTPS